MDPQAIVDAIEDLEADVDGLAEVAAAALGRLWRENELIDDKTVETLDEAAAGSLSRVLFEQYRNEETVSQLIGLVAARSEPDYVGDAVHDMALHLWRRSGRSALEAVFAATLSDIADRERNDRSLR